MRDRPLGRVGDEEPPVMPPRLASCDQTRRMQKQLSCFAASGREHAVIAPRLEDIDRQLLADEHDLRFGRFACGPVLADIGTEDQMHTLEHGCGA